MLKLIKEELLLTHNKKKYEEALYDLNKVNELEPDQREILKQIKDTQKMVKQAKKKDYYKILGVDKNATTEEIEKGYKKNGSCKPS